MDSYKQLEKHFEGLSGTCIEIGADRGQGSTPWLAKFIHERKIGKFITIDPVQRNDVDAIEHCESVNERAEEWLKDYKHDDICFVYMDGADFHGGERGLHVDEYSVMSHLEAAIEIEHHTAHACVIIFDDTNYCHYRCLGKGAFAVPYLIGNGFVVQESWGMNRFDTDLAAWVVLKR